MYQMFLEEYGLQAEECVFIDDTAENVEVARNLGFIGITFTTYDDMIRMLEKVGVQVTMLSADMPTSRGRKMSQYDLSRFHKAQDMDYETALSEICSGHKRSHWMWYIFPQVKGLGFSSMADYYGIDGLGEARAYLADDVLRSRLVEIGRALLMLDSNDASEVMGYPDDLKLRSSMTLFALADPEESVFQKVLDKYFGGKLDQRTVDIVKNKDAGNGILAGGQDV